MTNAEPEKPNHVSIENDLQHFVDLKKAYKEKIAEAKRTIENSTQAVNQINNRIKKLKMERNKIK